MKEIKLTKQHETTLHEQVIDTTQPGPILQDFQIILDYVGEAGVTSSGKYNLLPMSAIPELDERLSRPLKLTLKRPQLKSHPYLMGLHLLLRASGLGSVRHTGAKAKLVIEPSVVERWEKLNPAEQYFSLLEAWLLYGQPEMIGDGARMYHSYLGQVLPQWRYTTGMTETFDTSNPQSVYLPSLGRSFHQLALMDMFGLARLGHPHPPTNPWCPTELEYTPFGDALFTLFGQNVAKVFLDVDVEEEGQGDWQPFVQPYFPDWQTRLELPDDEHRKGVFVFRVSLGNMWRQLAIVDDATLDDLAYAILDAVDFDSDHLYRFIYRDHFGASISVNHPVLDEGPWTDQVLVGELPLTEGQAMTFHFDFGDDWKFKVKLEEIEPRRANSKTILVRGQHGEAPEQYPGAMIGSQAFSRRLAIPNRRGNERIYGRTLR